MPKTKTILIVDDVDVVRKFVHTILSASGYENLLEAEDAAQALDIVRGHQEPIHLLISDVVMPGGMDGMELAAAIHKVRPETKIVLMSGYEEQSGGGLPLGWHFWKSADVGRSAVAPRVDKFTDCAERALPSG